MADVTLVESKISFSSFAHLLDSRILRALADQGFARPTLIQSKSIPLALEGKDILARARTGSGKTAAYCIPVVQKIISAKSAPGSSENTQKTRGLILVPTRELAEQVTQYLTKLVSYCEREVVVANAASAGTTHIQSVIISDQPDIVIATPSRALNLLQSKACAVLSLVSLESLVIDEADLILSYGHDEDVRQILCGSYLPKVFQSFLMSATMTKDVETLKGLVLRNPAVLRLEEDEDSSSRLNQYSIHCSEVDKFLLTYVILKLKLVKGKCILFVNDVERSYRLKLFLEQFSIKSCVLNSELPLNSRYHIVQEFNKGVYDYIIATDEGTSGGDVDSDVEDETGSAEAHENENKEGEFLPTQRHDAEESKGTSVELSTSGSQKRKRSNSPPPARKKSKRVQKSDKEYGVSRGIDFISVSCVLNFDLPLTSRSYVHRIGRTARAGHSGIAISMVVPKDQWGKDKVVGGIESTKNDEKVFARITRRQKERGSEIKEWTFEQKKVEAFRYRMEDALRSVTRRAIGEARVKEITTEILNSDKLKAYFEDNPRTLEYLRHDKPLHPTRVQPHLKYVPKYLQRGVLPTGTAELEGDSSNVGFVPFKKAGSQRGRGRGRGRSGGGHRGGRGKKDPLKGGGRHG
ncbi:ATP-dependent RNA helicase dbp9 [Hysterangium stoloniferum]|nr:ATP-dependent RNA helicase dbp9 [Hysterangium stoloniferum]